MRQQKSNIPPMPMRLMAVPVVVGLFSIFIGSAAIGHHNPVWGWICITVGIVCIMGNYILRRSTWTRDANYRNRLLGKSR